MSEEGRPLVQQLQRELELANPAKMKKKDSNNGGGVEGWDTGEADLGDSGLPRDTSGGSSVKAKSSTPSNRKASRKGRGSVKRGKRKPTGKSR